MEDLWCSIDIGEIRRKVFYCIGNLKAMQA